MRPRPNVLYVICEDGSVQAVHEPERPIGWCVFENENGWFYQIAQAGFEPMSCILTYHSGYSREAAIYEDDEDDGEPEVTSNISFDVVDKIRHFAWPS